MLEFLRARTRTHQVAIAISTVDAPNRRPVFAVLHAWRRERSQARRVGVLPVTDQTICGMWGIDERVVVSRPLPCDHSIYLGLDRDHRVAEPIDFGKGFTFGRLDHQRSSYRE